jgi:hypothetical protein
MSEPAKTMLVIPAGTLIEEPDPLHRVTLHFPNEDAAIIFFEWARSIGQAREVEPTPRPSLRP